MKKPSALIAVLIVALGSFFGPAWAQETTALPDELKGVWVPEKVLHAGQEVPPDKFPFHLSFDDSRLIFRFVGEVKGKDRIHDIRVDQTRTPAELDITRQQGNRKTTALAIYKIEEERLLICFFRDSTERPATFESTTDVKSDLLVLKRKSDGK